MDGVTIRPYRTGDGPRIREITVEAFVGVSLEQRIDQLWPDVAPEGWAERKWLSVAGEIDADCDGCLIAESDGEVVGYVTTATTEARSQGRILNLAVDARLRGRGVGRALILAALGLFRRSGLRIARIETLANNPVGRHLYTQMGFGEIAQMVWYAMPLEPEGDS